ncbi:MAG: ABC transporter permease subunit, partial [Anaerolineae bacterium]
VFTQIPLPAHGLLLIAIGGYLMSWLRPSRRILVALPLLILATTLIFAGKPLALVGSSYIIIAAYAVRSLPASLRAGVASLQQIDPAIEEASTALGADAQVTFRRITLPLIAPAFLAGLIFAFARHMTSLSAIIFLTTPKWRILTVQILSAVEQGGLSRGVGRRIEDSAAHTAAAGGRGSGSSFARRPSSSTGRTGLSKLSCVGPPIWAR